MNFKSPIFLSFLLLSFLTIANKSQIIQGNNINIIYIIFAILFIENSFSITFYPFYKNLNKNDFRFNFAIIAAKIYYPITLIIIYLLYIYLELSLIQQSSLGLYNSLNQLFSITFLTIFVIFRVFLSEILNYLSKKNLKKPKSLQSILNQSNNIENNKMILIKEINSIIKETNNYYFIDELERLKQSIKFNSLISESKLESMLEKLTELLIEIKNNTDYDKIYFNQKLEQIIRIQ